MERLSKRLSGPHHIDANPTHVMPISATNIIGKSLLFLTAVFAGKKTRASKKTRHGSANDGYARDETANNIVAVIVVRSNKVSSLLRQYKSRPQRKPLSPTVLYEREGSPKGIQTIGRRETSSACGESRRVLA
jgi:hypothetical protein